MSSPYLHDEESFLVMATREYVFPTILFGLMLYYLITRVAAPMYEWRNEVTRNPDGVVVETKEADDNSETQQS